MSQNISLWNLCQEGRALSLVDRERIHYPDEGAGLLAQVEQTHFWFRGRRTLIERALRSYLPEGNLRGADVGCGTGYTAVWLSELGLPTIGIDANAGFIPFRVARRGAGFLAGDSTAVAPEAEFDFVLLLDVLEHLEDDLGMLQHVGRMLKPGEWRS